MLKSVARVTCPQFIRSAGYARGAEVCDLTCLLPEIRADRYPAPTGLGFLCAHGTCDPAVQSRYQAGNGSLAVLECPCNWFGADCQDDWVPIRSVTKSVLGDFHVTSFAVDAVDWRKVLQDHRPGGVVRVQYLDAQGVAREQPYVLASAAISGEVGVLEVLTGLPEAGMHPSVVEVAKRVRALPDGPVSSLYINPVIGGFFNSRGMFLMDALAAGRVQHVVMVATGTGLSGARSLISRIHASRSQQQQLQQLQLHLYYGIRDVQQLPYRGLLESWVAEGIMNFTLLVSSADSSRQLKPHNEVLAAAISRAAQLRELATLKTAVTGFLPSSGKLYVQHAVGLDFAAGGLRAQGARLLTTFVVICGRSELLRETREILEAICAGEGCETDVLANHVFTNI